MSGSSDCGVYDSDISKDVCCSGHCCAASVVAAQIPNYCFNSCLIVLGVCLLVHTCDVCMFDACVYVNVMPITQRYVSLRIRWLGK